jgi:Ca-activated chloride channel family protein
MKRILIAATTAILVLAIAGWSGVISLNPPLVRVTVAQTDEAGVISGVVKDATSGQPLPGATVGISALGRSTRTDETGEYRLENVPAGTFELRYTMPGYKTVKQKATVTDEAGAEVNIEMDPQPSSVEVFDSMERLQAPPQRMPSPARRMSGVTQTSQVVRPPMDREGYARIEENGFRSVATAPLSTFSIDVDGAAYSNVRRLIRDGEKPPVDAVRIEEMLNYFSYSDPAPGPGNDDPFAVTMETAPAPWADGHTMLRIGMQAKEIPAEDRPPTNLVFLLDVSGSMNAPNKLPLLKKSFGMLTDQLRAEDRVSIVVYAGASGTVLKPTPGNDKETIFDAIDELRAGGSTAGGAGIQAAYALAEENFDPKGINRVILATDGDFNVGASSDAEMIRLIEEKREGGVFLTVLGFGQGNLQDSKMEQIANHGNGTYSYIDSALEARKVLVSELGGTLQTLAKDVKLQLEFNPRHVGAYRLIGYENRLLDAEDFNDDTKDAGELGSGHHVTALYELVPPDRVEGLPGVDSLKYQNLELAGAADSPEWLTAKLRYKAPAADESTLIEQPLTPDPSAEASTDMNFALSVAGFGMILRDSEFRGTVTLADVRALAEAGRGEDLDGYRAGYIALLEDYRRMTAGTRSTETSGASSE